MCVINYHTSTYSTRPTKGRVDSSDTRRCYKPRVRRCDLPVCAFRRFSAGIIACSCCAGDVRDVELVLPSSHPCWCGRMGQGPERDRVRRRRPSLRNSGGSKPMGACYELGFSGWLRFFGVTCSSTILARRNLYSPVCAEGMFSELRLETAFLEVRKVQVQHIRASVTAESVSSRCYRDFPGRLLIPGIGFYRSCRF
jgi:hypothetical protein